MNKKRIQSTDCPEAGFALGIPEKRRRSGLTLKAILSAALELADHDGLDALSMREVAERSCRHNVPYTYVPKEDLIDPARYCLWELYASVEEPSQQPGIGATRPLHRPAQLGPL